MDRWREYKKVAFTAVRSSFLGWLEKTSEVYRMDFSFLMPTEVIFGAECVTQHANVFARYGKRALLVTGKNSARVSGALADVEKALTEQAIDWQIFDGVGENPTFAQVEAGAATAKQFSPDMIIAIGGGSPLDAAKAIATLATNEMETAALFDGVYAKAPLPVLAMPTMGRSSASSVSPAPLMKALRRNSEKPASRRSSPSA